MLYANKKFLRKEFDNLKSEFGKLTTENKISKQSQVLFKVLLMLFEVMLIIFIETPTENNHHLRNPFTRRNVLDKEALRNGKLVRSKLLHL